MATTDKIIIELDFDTSTQTKNAAKLTKEIATLNAENKKLDKTTSAGALAFQRNAETLKTSKKALSDTNKEIQNLTIANGKNAGSNDILKAQLSILTSEYNKLSKEERENTAIGKEKKAQINQVTEDLKENEEAVGNNRRSVGDYGKALEDAPFGSFIGGLKSMGAAFLANPAALVIAAIVGAFKLLSKAFSRNEENSNKLGKVTSALAGVFNFLLSVIEPVAVFIVDTVIKAFDDLGKAADAAIGLVTDALDALGFGDAADGITKWSNATAQAVKDAQDLDAAQNELVKSQREVEIIQLTSLKNAEKQRQIRDDESKSIEERMEANKELGKILEEQSVQELEIANESLRIADERIRLEGASTELLDARKDALVGVAEIEERITGQQSEQLVNVNSLLRDQQSQRKEAADKRAKIVQDGINQSKAEIDLFIANQGIRAKSLDEQIKIAEQVKDKELEILQRELDAKLISQTEYETQSLLIQQDFLALQTEATVDNAQRELDAIIEGNESKIEQGQFLSDELFAQEQERLQKNLDAQLEFEAQKLEQGVVSQQEYNDAINNVNKENEVANEELLAEKKEAEEEQKIVDKENQREIDDLNRENRFEQIQVDLDRQKELELANAQSTGASQEIINKKFAAFDKALEKDKRRAQLQEAAQAFDAIGVLVSGNSQAAKTAAIAAATINAYLGITAVLSAPSTIPEPFGSVAKGLSAAAIGVSALTNVRKIASTPVPSGKAAKGGMFGGKSHSQGGTKGYFDDGTQFEVEKDEAWVVLNTNSTAMLNNLSALNEMGGGVSFGAGNQTFMQDGGVGIGAISRVIDTEEVASEQITEALSSAPAPVVVVQDINEVQGTTAQVADRAII